MPRTAHYVSSTHWDREWYDSFQGYRMRLVSLLDEVLDTMRKDDAYHFTMDAQVVPIFDYLEVRPEKREEVTSRIRQGRLHVGPWYDLPDEWLVSGESLVRNIQMGTQLSRELGASAATPAIVDLFGHASQMPQILAQLGAPGTVIWRGTHEATHHGVWTWAAPDGTKLPVFRFGHEGYVTFWKDVRKPSMLAGTLDENLFVEKMVECVLYEYKRTGGNAVLLYDGGDHLEIEPRISTLIARANDKLAAHDFRIVHSTLDAFLSDVARQPDLLNRTLTGELRETGNAKMEDDGQWLIPGTLSSRIHLKQKNAACEDELTLWAEPFSAFAAASLPAFEYPRGYLHVAWKHLLENHPHDSICGCSIDQIHSDMLYRFDQSIGISSRLAGNAMRAIAAAATPVNVGEKSLVVTVFNPSAAAIDEMVDLDVRLPEDWEKKFAEFFGFEAKYAFRIRTADGREIPWQLVSQRDEDGFRVKRRHFPGGDKRHVISVTAPLQIPALGYTTLIVEPAEPPVRFLGSMLASHRAVENEHLRVEVAGNGTITLLDKRTRRTFENLLTFEERADIGDGWFHGIAVNDQVFSSAAAGADVAVVVDGPHKATLRLAVTMNVPEEFDFRLMRRSQRTSPLRITSDITLRKGAAHLEVETTIENSVRDHRVRVLLPTMLEASHYSADAVFDAVTRPIALLADNAARRELDVETRPQQTWTALTDGSKGLAVAARGLPESAVLDTPDRPIALTLLRGFRRAVFQGLDRNPGGQVLGTHTFRYRIVPFAGEVPAIDLFHHGQRVLSSVRQVDSTHWDRTFVSPPAAALRPEGSFLAVDGAVVVSSVQRDNEHLLVRLFNPADKAARATLALPRQAGSAAAVTLAGKPDPAPRVVAKGACVTVDVPAKRITTVLIA